MPTAGAICKGSNRSWMMLEDYPPVTCHFLCTSTIMTVSYIPRPNAGFSEGINRIYSKGCFLPSLARSEQNSVFVKEESMFSTETAASL
jgi:hypothetical protein